MYEIQHVAYMGGNSQGYKVKHVNRSDVVTDTGLVRFSGESVTWLWFELLSLELHLFLLHHHASLL